MNNYTPCPWGQAGPSFGLGKMQYSTDIVTEYLNDCCVPVTICHIPGFDCFDEENEANAALIAAAPDLLESLQLLVDGFGDTPSEKAAGLAESRAAIKKARGES